MRRQCWALLACVLTGCSTHPIVDVLDYFKPGRLGPNDVQPYGGVCIPQGPVQPPAAPPVVAPGAVPAPPTPGVVPPPAPLPGAPATIPTPIPVPTAAPPPPAFPR